MPAFLGMLHQAAQLQSTIKEMQEQLDRVEVGRPAGGGLVTGRMTAKLAVKAVAIDPSLMKADEREVLEDLLVTAHNDARRKAEEAMQEKMKSLTGGLLMALKYSVSSYFVFRHAKYVYDCEKPAFASQYMIFGRVNASARKMTSGCSFLISRIVQYQNGSGFVCGSFASTIRTRSRCCSGSGSSVI